MPDLKTLCTHILMVLLVLPAISVAQQPHWKYITPVTRASFRGLSVIDDSVAWIGGTNGYVGRTTDGGDTWRFGQVDGYEQCDFRSVYAFDAQHAVIANAGAPAFILLTADGGLHWKKVYENQDTAAFIDGLSFRDRQSGITYGLSLIHI